MILIVDTSKPKDLELMKLISVLYRESDLNKDEGLLSKKIITPKDIENEGTASLDF